MPRIVSRGGYLYEDLGHSEYGFVSTGADDNEAGKALLTVAAIIAGVTLYWWEVEGKGKRAKRRRQGG